MLAIVLTLALAPGAHVTVDKPASCWIGVNSVRTSRVLPARWRDEGTLETWRAKGGLVTFDGITIANHSRQRVVVKASC
jgi:hypothetical protein